MANRRFPRSNGRNNNNRDRPDSLLSNCVLCNQQIQILNDDILYSWNLHMQSHKSLDSIDQDVTRQLTRAGYGSDVQRKVQSNCIPCPECNENVPIFDLELHAQKHKNSGMRSRGDDQSSTSSGRSYNRKQNCVKSNTETVSEGRSVLDNTFYKMPPGLKAHRGFVSENESGEVVCGLCNVKIDSLNKIADHLVTKSHEDKTIFAIKSQLPQELHETMDFVSFYGSNLCCNLCKCKIDLNSLSLSGTSINIIAHNAGQQHVKKKGKNEPSYHSNGVKKLNFLASKDSLINNNKHLISCDMQPRFRCKLCDKLITFDQDDQMLLKNFTSHLLSNGHNKCVKATSVLATFNGTYQPKTGKHNLVVTKGSITCTVCNTSVEPSLEVLDAHVKEIDSFANVSWPEDLSARINGLNVNIKSAQPSCNVRGQSNEALGKKVNALLKCMPMPYRNADYIVESSQGQVTCLICNCVIPSTPYNLETHLTGSSHMKNLSSTQDELGESRPLTTTATSAQSQQFNPFMKGNSSAAVNATTVSGMSEVLDYLKKTDPLIRRNVNLLEKHNDVYFCKLCNITIPKSNDTESFKKNLTSHLSSSKHGMLYAAKQESEITKLLTFDPFVRANKQYLRRDGESLLCTLCEIPLSMSMDGIKLKKSVTEHLRGQQHQSKLEKITTSQEPSSLFSNQVRSFQAQCHPSDFANNAAKSSSMLQIPSTLLKGFQASNTPEEPTNIPQRQFLVPNPIEHFGVGEFPKQSSNKLQTFDGQLKAPQNLSGSEESTSRSQKLPSLLTNTTTEPLKASEFSISAKKSSNLFQTSGEQPTALHMSSKPDESNNRSQKPVSSLSTEPLRERPVNIKPKELKVEPPKPEFPNPMSTDLVVELFRRLPGNFQSDIAFIKKSSMVEGFLACSLCGTNHINPHNLQKHLEGKDHEQGKVARHPPSSKADNQTSASSKKMMQNMKSFFGFN